MTHYVSSNDIEPLQTCESQTSPIVWCYHQLNCCVLHNCTLK